MTIKDVAQRSGYAVGTVSRVLNGQPGVSAEARERILAVLEQTGFKPNTNARHLKQRGSREIGIIVKGANNLLFAGIVEEMQSLLKAAGMTASLYYVDEYSDEVELAAQICREQKPRGILFLGGNGENFARRFADIACPCMLVTTRADTFGFSNLSSVCTDDLLGAAQAMDYLLDAGHRMVGVIGGEHAVAAPGKGSNTSQLRLLGCQQACQQHAVPFDPARQVVTARYSLAGGYAGARALLDRCPGLTAIIAMSDVMAMGALRAIHDAGLRVPQDISLIGYDGIEQAAYCVPRLTTIRQNAGLLARRGVDILLRQMDSGEAVHELVPFELVEGESVRRLDA